MNHKQKNTLARRLRTRQEHRDKVPIFQTKAWEIRAEYKKNKRNNKPKSKKYDLQTIQGVHKKTSENGEDN